MGEVLLSDVTKCCLRYDLVIGCAIYVTVEVYLWAIMSLASAYTELKLIENHEAVAFRNFARNSTYYVTAFGSPSDELGRAVICKLSCNSRFFELPWLHSDGENSARKASENRFSLLHFFAVTQIVINGILVAGFVLYCIFAVILLIGISEVCSLPSAASSARLTENYFLVSEKFGVFRVVPLSRHIFLVRVVGVRCHRHFDPASCDVQELFDLCPQILSFVVRLFAVQKARRLPADLLQLHVHGAEHADKQSHHPAGPTRRVRRRFQ